jgi:hypothetical protein
VTGSLAWRPEFERWLWESEGVVEWVGVVTGGVGGVAVGVGGVAVGAGLATTVGGVDVVGALARVTVRGP